MPSIGTQASSGTSGGHGHGGGTRGSFSSSVSGSVNNLVAAMNNNSSSGTRGSVNVPPTTGVTRMSVSFTGDNLPLHDADLALAPLPSHGSSPEDNLASIDQKLCLLPGLSDMAAFRECLASTTFVLQVT